MAEKYLEYIHSQPKEDTIAKFFYKNKSIVEGQDIIDFLKYDGNTGKNNIQRIYDKYEALDKVTYRDFVNSISTADKNTLSRSRVGELPLYNNPILLIPKDLTKLELVSISGKNLFLERHNFQFFFADKLFQLLSDPGYVRSENLSRLQGRGLDIEVIRENVQVWIWSRALNKIVDVSPFISQLSTDKSEIGSFSINLNPVESVQSLISVDVDNVLNYFFLNNEDSHNIDFFYRNFQYNDIAFIRFEKLQLEKSNKIEDFNIYVNKNQLPDQVWDMIGLIDNCSMNQSFQNSSSEISISGRDLMKLLIEDGSYFMNLALLQGSDQKDIIVGFNKDDKWFKRNIFSGKFGGEYSPYWFPNSVRKISDTVGFIINQLSNLGVLAGEDLFSSYQDRRTQSYKITGLDDKYLNSILVDGVWQIIKILIDSSVDSRRISDDSLSYVDGTILEQINKACQKPFVEFFGDTYGNEFDLIVRQPPFTKDMILSFLYGIVPYDQIGTLDKGGYQIIDIEAKDLQGYNSLEWDQTYYSWYQLNPNDSFLGAYNKLAVGNIIPIIYFTEIAEIFGNHRMIVQDNYLNENIVEGAESQKDKNSYRRALLNDLKYVIDSNVYLPFTRRGTLTLVKGDRRIKRGIFIRVKPTNEVFYVDSVSNNISFTNDRVDRSTTIRVSRGMIEDYVYGAKGYDQDGKVIYDKGKPVRFSYFDIVKTDITSTSQVIEEVDSPSDYQDSQGNDYDVVIGDKNSVADINNNPGNLQYVSGMLYATQNGRWAKYDTAELGFKGLINQIKIDSSRNLTVDQFINKYHPVSENGTNRTELYISRLNNTFKTTKSTKIKDIDTIQLAKFIAKEESNTVVKDKRENIVSSKVQPSTLYSVTMGKKDITAFINNNPGIVRDFQTKEVLKFETPEKGFVQLMIEIKIASTASDTMKDFLHTLLDTGSYSLSSSFNEIKNISYIRQKMLRSEKTKVSDLDQFKFAQAIISVLTQSTVTKTEEQSPQEQTKKVQSSQQNTKKSKVVMNDNFNFKVDKQQLDFFLKRQQMNLYQYGRSK